MNLLKNLFLLTLGTLIVFEFIAWESRQSFKTAMQDKYGFVCVTKTGNKYHACYHYSGRNSSISFYQAITKGYTQCSVCNSPSEINFSEQEYYPNWFYRHYLISGLAIVVAGIFIQLRIQKRS
jgi:hypothetical protein